MKTPAAPNPEHTRYENLINLLAVYSEASARSEQLKAEINADHLDLIDAHKKAYAELQQTITEAEAAIIAIAEANPDWFSASKTLKTPYGQVASRSSTSLDVPNEEASIILIEQKCDEETKGQLLRQKTELNLEALELLDDAALRQYRIKRVTSENITVKPAKLDLGKAVKAAAGKEAA